MHNGIYYIAHYLCGQMNISMPFFRTVTDTVNHDLCRYDIDTCEIVVTDNCDVGGSLFSLAYALRLYYLHTTGQLFTSASFTKEGLNAYSDLSSMNPEAYRYASMTVGVSDLPSSPLFTAGTGGRAKLNPVFEYNPIKQPPQMPDTSDIIKLKDDLRDIHRKRRAVAFYTDMKKSRHDTDSSVLPVLNSDRYDFAHAANDMYSFYDMLDCKSAVSASEKLFIGKQVSPLIYAREYK